MEMNRAIRENMILPEIVKMEKFLECVRRRGEGGRGVARVLERKIEEERAREHSMTSTSDTSDHMWSSEEDATALDKLTLHLNPFIPISTEEYETWMDLCRNLRRSNTLSCGDTPRKLLMLMSPACTAVMVTEAMEALIRLFSLFKEEWFPEHDFRILKKIVKRGLAATGVQSPEPITPSARRARLKQRRKVFKARKKIWEDERHGRGMLEDQFDELLTAFKMQQLHPTFSDLPTWFTSLLHEHHASLEEQYARSLLETEYAGVLNKLTQMHETVS
eukprot:TRINITY_DN3728_c0_g1_i4.p2 TRINITY_DN3728_c0_g1~~TRINITY_DN3728_c0_g1_i4.p2  ORF type:complete len:276 (+),score=60.76 TRINITY_DN3728_c0_g1_i4:184-1011(+)